MELNSSINCGAIFYLFSGTLKLMINATYSVDKFPDDASFLV
jgi:hypothetical protein